MPTSKFLTGMLLTGAAFAADRPDPAAVERGRKEFVSACGFCHGDDATGNRAPDLIRSVLINHDEHGELIGPMIANGRPDKGMPGLPLNAQQVSDIVTFLHEQLHLALASSRVPGDYPVKKLLTGNSKLGAAYFNGEGHCNACHSVSGDLAGIGKRYSAIDLQSHFLYPRARLRTAKVTLPGGDSVSGTLDFLDEFEVAIHDASGQYHSWPRDAVKVEIHDPLEVHRELLRHYTDDQVHNLFAYLETLQ